MESTKGWDLSMDNIIRDIENGVTTRHSLNLFSEHIAFVSQAESLSIEEAVKDEFWIMSMHEELNQFKRNDVRELKPYSKNMNIVDIKWVFKYKLDGHGLITRNEARLLAKGYNQQLGIDFCETCALVARPLSLVAPKSH